MKGVDMKGAGIKGTGKMTDELKLKIYPAIVGVLGVCLVASLLSHFEVQILTESSPPQRPTPEMERSPLPPPSIPSSSAPPLITEETTATSPVPPPSSQLSSPSPASSVPSRSAAQGSLRVSNQTSYPIRVALLPKQSGTSAIGATSKPNRSSLYQQPVHWDFSPGEGKVKGLRLSLPDDTLKIQSGDILVAFAQDGSRRYWGPYVVGQTLLPIWNKAVQEWQLDLQP